MADPLGADRLMAALRAEGCRVIEEGGWRTHTRTSSSRPWGPVHGVMIHHTVTKGTANTVKICHDGYRDLPGPLCHGVIAKDGTVHLVGYGRANHAGAGDPDVLQAVIAERALPADDEASTDGNRHFYGFECENLGDGEDPWPEAQRETIDRVGAAVCRAHGWNERSVIGHLDWQPGKIDPLLPGGMGGIRGRVGGLLRHPAGWSPVPPEPVLAEPTLASLAKALTKTAARLSAEVAALQKQIEREQPCLWTNVCGTSPARKPAARLAPGPMTLGCSSS